MSTIVDAARQTDVKTGTLNASSTLLYRVSVRVRGVIDLKRYTGGTELGPHLVLAPNHAGVTPVADNRTIVSLSITNPAATYYLNVENEATQRGYNVPLDYTFDLWVKGGAVWTLTVDNVDTKQFKGDVADALITKEPVGAYDGIWLQVDTTPSEPFATYDVETGSGVRGWIFSAFAENAYGVKAEQ